MAIPKQSELKKKQEFKESLIKKIGGKDTLEEYKSDVAKALELMNVIRLSEKQMVGIIRSSIRKSWMQNPVRLLKLEIARIPDMNESTRTKWLWECCNCKNKFKGGEVQTDHIKGEHQLKTLKDVEPYARSILDVTLDDLQIMCIPCHETKTYAERFNMSFEDAKLEKLVIAWQKKNNVAQQKEFLYSIGYTGSDHLISNGNKRKNAYRTYLKEQKS